MTSNERVVTLLVVHRGRAVSLNIDLGELENEPEALYEIATIANVACGGHAGDEESIRRAVTTAARCGASVSAHPSYPDREGFGRRGHFASGRALESALDAQLELLARVAKEEGVPIIAMKPHGALYHDAASDPALARSVLESTAKNLGRVAIMGLAEGALADLARAEGWTLWPEGFADRRYSADGRIVPRSEAGALLTDLRASAEQALELARSERFETLCVHGDTPGAVEIARAVRTALTSEGLLALSVR